MTPETEYFQDLLEDAKEQQAAKSTFDKWFKARQAFAVDEDEEVPREEDCRRAWDHGKPKRRKYPKAPDNLPWRKHKDFPIEVSPYATARWLEDGKAHKAGDWLDLYPNGFGVLFYRLWDKLRQRQVYRTPSQLLVETGWIAEPRYRGKKANSA